MDSGMLHAKANEIRKAKPAHETVACPEDGLSCVPGRASRLQGEQEPRDQLIKLSGLNCSESRGQNCPEHRKISSPDYGALRPISKPVYARQGMVTSCGNVLLKHHNLMSEPDR